MKKLVTLILVLAGIVGSASAASIRHGLIVEVKGDLKDWSGWNYPILHLWYNNGVEDVTVTGSYGSTHLTWLRNTETSQVWYYSFSVDENYKEFSFILNANDKGDDKWNRVTVNNQDFSCDKYFSLALHTDAYSDNVPYVESTTDVPYYFVAADGTKLATLQNTVAVYTGEFTNTAETYAVLAPEYAIQDDGTLNWSLVYRPNNEGVDYLINTFMIYSDGMTADNKTFKFTEEMSYKLSFDLTSSPEFTITPYITRTINPSVGFATFSYTDDVAIPAGVTAWFAKEVDAQGRLIMKKYLKCIPSYEGALLQGSGEVTFTPAGENDWEDEPVYSIPGDWESSINLLKESADEEMPLYPHGKYLPDNYHYILAGTSASDVGFYYVDQQRNSAIGKAYLKTSVPLIGTDAGARAAWVFDEEGETTGINEVKTTKPVEGFFNLAGQRVAKPAKGLYIVNGKKAIMK